MGWQRGICKVGKGGPIQSLIYRERGDLGIPDLVREDGTAIDIFNEGDDPGEVKGPPRVQDLKGGPAMRDGGGGGGQHRIGFLGARQRRMLSLSPRLELLAKCILENWSERAGNDYLSRFQSTHQSFPVGSGTG